MNQIQNDATAQQITYCEIGSCIHLTRRPRLFCLLWARQRHRWRPIDFDATYHRCSNSFANYIHNGIFELSSYRRFDASMILMSIFGSCLSLISSSVTTDNTNNVQWMYSKFINTNVPPGKAIQSFTDNSLIIIFFIF